MNFAKIKQENIINLKVYNLLQEINQYLIKEYDIDISDKIPKYMVYIDKKSIIYPNFIDKYIIENDGKNKIYYIDDNNKAYRLKNNRYNLVGEYKKDECIIKLF